MKTMSCVAALAVFLVCSSAVQAQSDKTIQQRTIAEALDSWITNTETHLVEAADAMPEETYSFTPPEAYGEFKGVRTFAQQVKHLAANNYGIATLILGKTRTAEMLNETGPDSVRTKAEIMEYLRGSFTALHNAVATIDETNVVQPATSTSAWQKTRLSFAVDAVAHSFDHYGQIVEYLRMNGIVPPNSRPKKPQESTAIAAVDSRRAAPDFVLTNSKGTLVKLSEYKGKVVLLDFWATWCGGCKVEIPWYMEFEQKYKARGLAAIGVAMDEDGWKSVTPYLKQHPINYSIVVGNADFGKLYSVDGLPVTLLIDRNGKIAATHTGMVEKDKFESEIRLLLRDDSMTGSK
jgi:cytochrome c biogenesis protein CcmG/thiol:disulfide interchange protein DsbE